MLNYLTFFLVVYIVRFFSSIYRAEQLRVLTTFTKDVLFVSTNKAKL